MSVIIAPFLNCLELLNSQLKEHNMNVQANLRLGKREFLAWVQGREGRYELADSRVVMMTGGTRGHVIILRRLARSLEERIDPEFGTVLTSDFGVDVGQATIRYPDIVVDAAGGAFGDLTATAPILIAEVVSPSSATYDLGDKASEYLRLPDLKAYLVVAQHEAKAWVWVRGPSGFSPGATVIEGREAIIEIPALNLSLPLSEIFSDLE
jgi:Uma2 family endonuclease